MNVKMLKAAAATLVLAGAIAAPSQAATVLLNDTFTGPGYALNTAPPGWSVIGGTGTVDWVADNTYSIRCIGNTGGCVDLDGSTSNAGIMTNGIYTLEAGVQYTFSAYLSANQRNIGTDTVVFGFRNSGGVIQSTSTISLSENPDLVPPTFALYTLLFTPGVTYTGVSLFFEASGGDNIGPIVDNVSLTAVPLPAAAWLLLSGLAGLGFVGRRRKVA